jgi:hypothetical protein
MGVVIFLREPFGVCGYPKRLGRWIFGAKFLQNFSARGKCVFAGCFGGIGVQNVVFLWTACGGMRGKDGLRMCGFWCSKIMQFLWIYFWDGFFREGLRAGRFFGDAGGVLEVELASAAA